MMPPLGIRFLDGIFCTIYPPQKKRRNYAIWTWILTFCVYITYHLSRKPISVVKNVLNENCSSLVPPHPTNNTHWCDWKPFDEADSSALLGTLDSSYLFTYAFGMFFSGYIAERMKLNTFLCLGMLFSGLFTAMFGLGKTFNIHAFWYYLLVQMLCGIVQSTGWPGVVAAMGNWFGKKKRGLIMGIWNSHTSIGNILGTLIADAFLISGWDLSFIVPGALIACMGIIVYLFLVPDPSELGLENPNCEAMDSENADDSHLFSSEETERLLPTEGGTTASSPSPGGVESNVPPHEILSGAEDKPIRFLNALRIPGVIEFSFSLFFSKLVSYTFLYWLPHFIHDNTKGSVTQSGNLSTFFDVGGILGGILAGIFSDTFHTPALTCTIMLIISIPLMFFYQIFASTLTVVQTIIFLIPVGVFVNGPYALITTAVSAELGTHSSLQNSKALSTVTSIIDGTGSLGAAVGPLLAGILSGSSGWSNVFYMLMGANVISIICLFRLVKRESRFCRFW